MQPALSNRPSNIVLRSIDHHTQYRCEGYVLYVSHALNVITFTCQPIIVSRWSLPHAFTVYIKHPIGLRSLFEYENYFIPLFAALHSTSTLLLPIILTI